MEQEKRENIFTLRIPEIGYEGSVSVKVIKKEKIAEIRIVNYEGNKDVTEAISIVNDFLKSVGVNATAIEISKDESASLTIEHTKGINAVYLVGDSKNNEALVEYSNTLNLPGAANVFNKGDRESIENARGYNYTVSGQQISAVAVSPYQGGNGAVIGLDKFYKYDDGFSGGSVDVGFQGKNINPAHAIALTILHVMGHNAGISGKHNPSRYPTGIMTDGSGLLHAMETGSSFSDFTSMSKENKQNRVWRAFVRNYFNGSGDATSIFRDLHRGFLMSYLLQFIKK